jgi:membrane protein DedA with SNARE-associated domain
MTFELLIARYGLPAIFLGTMLEGETVVIIGGFLAHRGYLSLFGVIIAATIGTLLADQFFFFLGLRTNTFQISD